MKTVILTIIAAAALIGFGGTAYSHYNEAQIPASKDVSVKDFGTEIDTRIDFSNNAQVEAVVVNMAAHKACKAVLTGAMSELPIILTFDGTTTYAVYAGSKQAVKLGKPCTEAGQNSLIRTLGFELAK